MGLGSYIRKDNSVIITCSECGRQFDLSDYTFDSPITVIMREGELCHQCAFWKEMLEYPEQPFEIIEGSMWTYGRKTCLADNPTNRPPAYIMRPNGSLVKIEYPVCLGAVPERMRERWKDTGRFIDQASFAKIRSNIGLSCRAVGCYDRYHCYWYDVEAREPKGAWNQVPAHHKVGNEKCPKFVNKVAMYIKRKKL